MSGLSGSSIKISIYNTQLSNFFYGPDMRHQRRISFAVWLSFFFLGLNAFCQRTPAPELTADTDLIRISSDASNLAVSELFVLERAGNERDANFTMLPFEIVIPADARLVDCVGEDGRGEATALTPLPHGAKGIYRVNIIARPGQTKVQVVYQMPYAGLGALNVQTTVVARTLAVMLPKSMKLAARGAAFQSIESDSAVNVFVLHDVRKGEKLELNLSGYGALRREEGKTASDAHENAAIIQSPATGKGQLVPERWKEFPRSTTRLRVVLTFLAIGFAMAGYVGYRFLQKQKVEASAAAIRPDAVPAMKEKLFALQVDLADGTISADAYQRRLRDLRSALSKQVSSRPEGRSKP